MSKRKSHEIHVKIPKGSGGNNTRHLRVSLPSKLVSGNKSRKSLLVLAPKVSKHNLGTTSAHMMSSKMTKIIEKHYPKTKFSSGDKSQDPRSISPRLKEFPAEKIKKIDGNTLLQQAMTPQLNNFEPYCTPAEKNTGCGDALASAQQIQPTPRHQSRCSSASQQNVPKTYRIENPNQSEAALPSQKIEAPSGQQHRPFVSVLPNGVIIRQIVPAQQDTPKPPVPQTPPVDLTNSSQEQTDFKRQEKESSKQQNEQQESPDFNSEIPLTDYVKQPVGGRVAALHQKRLLEQKQASQKAILESQQHPPHHQVHGEEIQSHQVKHPIQQHIPQEQIQQQLFHIQNAPPVPHNHVSVCSHAAPTRQQMQSKPQEVYQQLQRNAAYQQHMHHRAMAHQEQMMMNQMQQRAHYDYYNQHQLNNQALTNQGMTSPQDRFIHRGRNLYMNRMQMSTGSQGHQNLIPSDASLRAEVNPFAIDLVTPYQTPQTTHNSSQPGQNSVRNNLDDQHMRSIPQKQIEVAATQQEQSEVKKVYYFTPQMKKDQELLIATMQQQRIPEEVMQRQFLLLLNEQKKQLAYLELLSQSEEIPDKSHTQFVQRKVTKIHSHEKPDWMTHLTPPQVSYRDLEKVKTYSSNQNMQSLQNEEHQNNQEAVHQQQVDHQRQVAHQQQVDHQQQIAYQQRLAHQNYQMQLQQQHARHQMMEGQRSDQPMTSNFYHPYDRTGLPPTPFFNNAPNHLQHQCLQCSYPHHHQHLHPQFQDKHFQKSQQSTTANNPEANLKMIPHQPETKNKIVEPSSLLKLRFIKEYIQPQKRNNGLQDPQTVQEALEALKNAESKKGLEYLANLNQNKAVVRLNGAQEPGLVPDDLMQQPPRNVQEIPKHVSANGLENKRNLNNPLPPPAAKIRYQEGPNFEFPRVKNSYKLQKYTHVAERENGSVASNLHHQHPQDYAHQQTFPQNASLVKDFGNHQQLQQFYNNRQAASNAQGDAVVPELNEVPGNKYVNQAGGDIQETKLIGGVTYLGRKPSTNPKIQISPESYSGNNHILQNTVP